MKNLHLDKHEISIQEKRWPEIVNHFENDNEKEDNNQMKLPPKINCYMPDIHGPALSIVSPISLMSPPSIQKTNETITVK